MEKPPVPSQYKADSPEGKELVVDTLIVYHHE